jgi:lysozyme
MVGGKWSSKSTAFAMSGVLLLAAAIVIGSCKKAKTFPHVNKIPGGIFFEQIPRARGTLRAISDKSLRLTEESEGFEPNLYDDAANYCSIAFGHLVKRTLCDGTEPAEFQDGVSLTTGRRLLIGDMTKAQTVVMLSVTRHLTDGQYGALCDFVYNVGGTRFRSSTLRRVVNNNQFYRVPGQFRRWVRAGGKPLKGLVERREREIVLFFGGRPTFREVPTPGEDLSPLDVTVGER